MNKNKKISTLDLAKTLSDFLFLWVENPEEKARKVFELKHSLTDHGFEKYIEYYFRKTKKYDIHLNGDTHEFDGWIDLIWTKEENWVKIKTFVQCKKYSVCDISEDLIRNYYGGVANKIQDKDFKFEIYFITTSKFTHRARAFWEEINIKLIDFHDIYKLQEFYTLVDFKSDIFKMEWKKEYEKCFLECEVILDLYDNYFNIIEPTEHELYEFLKQIRRDYSWEKQLRLWDIATNETLEVLAKKRPHSFEELKKIVNNFPNRERNKMLRHWRVFISRLRYFKEKKEEDLSVHYKVEKGFWSSFFGVFR